MLNSGFQDKIGVSTACFYPEVTEKAFDTVCTLDVRVCEIFINTHSETRPDYLRDIKLKAEDNNISVSAVHPYFSGYEAFLFFSGYDMRRFWDSVDLYRPVFEAARFLGSEYVIFHGPGPASMKLPVDEYNGRYLLIAEEAKKYGCELLHENIGTINDYLQDLKDIRFTLDFKHSLSRGHDNLEIIEKMNQTNQTGSNIRHIHINDMVLSGSREKVDDCRLPFAGTMDYKKIFEKLMDINYIGNFIIEVYRHNYTNTAEISESIRKLRDFCGDL